MRKITFIIFFICFTIIKTFSQTGIGIDCNQPIDNYTGAIYPSATAAAVATTCTQWVRVNFILGPWSSPSDQTLYSGKTWKQTYDEIVNGFLQQGIQVYGLVGAQAVSQQIGDMMIAYPGTDFTNATAWKDEYISNFVTVVDYFKDRIRVYESYNEPNNWDNGSTSVVHAKWFALLLQDIYLNVKHFNGHSTDPAWQVTLVSGAILTMDNNGTGGYINDTYWYGINELAWSWTQQETGSFPLDGVGMHIYVEQGSTNVTAITNAMNLNLNSFWADITTYEGATTKQLWISEFGWQSDIVGYQGQADNLTTSFNVLKSDSRIALALWFTLSDWPGATWGIYEFGNFPSSDQKLSFNAFKNQVNCYATELLAAVDCSGNVNLIWTNFGSGWYIDISTVADFSTYSNMDVSNLTSTIAPSGFSPAFTFLPNTTYYWRVWNGSVHATGNSFSIPSPLAAPTIVPSGITTFCQGGNVTLDAGTGYSTYTWSTGATSQTINVTNSDNYSVTITDGNGCLASSSATAVTVDPIPPIPTITQNGSILTSSATTGNQWFLNGNSITNAALQNYAPVQSGIYTVTVTDMNNCSATSTPFNFTTTAIESLFVSDEQQSEITIYPNPGNGVFNLGFRNKDGSAEPTIGIGTRDAELCIYNALGEKMHSEKILLKPLSLNLDLPIGIYFMKVLMEGTIYDKKIIVQ